MREIFPALFHVASQLFQQNRMMFKYVYSYFIHTTVYSPSLSLSLSIFISRFKCLLLSQTQPQTCILLLVGPFVFLFLSCFTLFLSLVPSLWWFDRLAVQSRPKPAPSSSSTFGPSGRLRRGKSAR